MNRVVSYRLTDTVNKLVEENESLKQHKQYHSLPYSPTSPAYNAVGGETHYASVGPPAAAVARASPGPKAPPPAPPARSNQTVSMYERPVSRSGSVGSSAAAGLGQQPASLPAQPAAPGGNFMTLQHHHHTAPRPPPGSPFSPRLASLSFRVFVRLFFFCVQE